VTAEALESAGAVDAPAGPSIYQAMAAVMRDITAVGKNGFNEKQRYHFRGIDDLMTAVAQPLRDHGVIVLPEVRKIDAEVRGEKSNAVRLVVTFHFVGPCGDEVTATTVGEGADVYDKACNKAMAAALKYALLQVFMIPVDAGSVDDGDRHNPEGTPAPQSPHEVNELFGAIKGAWANAALLRTIQGEARERRTLNLVGRGPSGDDITADQLIQQRLRELDPPKTSASEERTPERPVQRGPQPDGEQWETGDASEDRDERAAAQQEMYDAATEAGVPADEADRQFYETTGHAVIDGSVDEFRKLRDHFLEGSTT